MPCTPAGFLPFSAIYIELYYIFASVWGHKVYTIYSILFIVFIILIIVTAFITVALTYFQLAVEDYTWWWRSFVCGGSTGQSCPCQLHHLPSVYCHLGEASCARSSLNTLMVLACMADQGIPGCALQRGKAAVHKSETLLFGQKCLHAALMERR